MKKKKKKQKKIILVSLNINILFINVFATIKVSVVMVFNTTFNNISVISYSQVYWWRKPEYPEKTIDMSQVNDKL